jgi:asparagine synthase (glutamine-hydrolysing)
LTSTPPAFIEGDTFAPTSPTHLDESTPVAYRGRFAFADDDLAALAATQGPATALREGFERYGIDLPRHLLGRFAIGVRDRRGRTLLAVDRFAIDTICYRLLDAGVTAHPRADVAADRGATRDPQAIFDYLYFHDIPAPRTWFEGVARLPAAHRALVENGRASVARWWKPVFADGSATPFATLRDEFRALLRDATSRQLDGQRTGTFLSGGTDSSTIAGMLGAITGAPAPTFSIGFDASGYDEMEYARIAARHFGTEHHEYYVTPADLVAAIGDVARSYDQPFGNSSVVPAYFCARLAREHGVTRLLGGDGGDELFGGNSRYAKQRVFSAYDAIPGVVQRGLVEPLFADAAPLARLPVLRKLGSYVTQARVPLPDRLQMYNLVERIGIGEILTADFLASVDPQAPLRQQREAYAESAGAAPINRMLAFDWRYTLADNDLPKVVGATALAGLPVGFPFLDEAMVDFSLKLAPSDKLKGLKLRWFFKEALRGFLPDAILAKRKHGFGLPFGVWVAGHPALRDFAIQSIRDLGGRAIVRREFIDRLLGELLPAHPAYYGEMVWVLLILEQWLRGR